MKTVRIWFLLLLAVLLPIRGAVAAAMLCPVGGSGVQSELRLSDHSKAHEALDHAMDHDHAMSHDHGSAGHSEGEHNHTVSDKCKTCSAYCSLTPLLSSVLPLLEPLDFASVKFFAPSALPPSFISDGQERPPRII